MYFNRNCKDVLKELETDIGGINNEEANRRIKKYGLNILPHKKQESVIKIFFKELLEPIELLLLVAIIVSCIVGEYFDAITIAFIVLIDVVMGTYQENKANNTAKALAKLVKVTNHVLRDNKLTLKEAKDITIGDIVLLESGDKIPADIRLIESYNFQVNESILTGESQNVSKISDVIKKENIGLSEQKNMLFAGTNVVTGRAKGVVVKIGMDTELGQIANKINYTKEEKSPLSIRISKFSKQICYLILFVAIILTFLLYEKGFPTHEILLSVIALAVSAMPEGLPLALTMALTIGANKMAKKNVIVRKLNSVESLGSCTIIASDKTGTLTINKQTLKKVVLPNDDKYEIELDSNKKIIGNNIEEAKKLVYLGMINNEASFDGKDYIGDSIDIAFKVAGDKLKLNYHLIDIVSIIPYESEQKYSAVFYKYNDEYYCTVKGALEKIASFCKKINIDALSKQNNLLAEDGYRVIAIANGKIKLPKEHNEEAIKNLEFMGLTGFIDPIRKEAVKSINECRKAGIDVIMITGDHPLTAYNIAKKLKIVDSYDEVTDGEILAKYILKDEKTLDNFIQNKKVFSRVSPLQKQEIVNSLKRLGHFVAVTGDGVNDAPALKSANIGISMGSGTELARETSKMIIKDDNFKSIVAGVKEGRVAYQNIRKIIYYLISCGLAEVFFFTLAIIFDLPMPLVAIQLLWLNVVTDGIQDFALSFEVGEDDIMDIKPRNPKDDIFDKNLKGEVVFSGLLIGIIIFAVWYYLIKWLNMDITLARTYIMTLMVLIQNFHVFNCRSENKSAFDIPLKKNKIVAYGVFASILLHLIVLNVKPLATFLKIKPIPFTNMILLILLSSLVLIIMEVYKLIKRGLNDYNE